MRNRKEKPAGTITSPLFIILVILFGVLSAQTALASPQKQPPRRQTASPVPQRTPPSSAPAPALTREARVDRVFERWDHSDTPGCAVGVAVDGIPVLVRAYGMANLEYGLRIRADTIFESGSVAKQFTAAAIALLVQDGKLFP